MLQTGIGVSFLHLICVKSFMLHQDTSTSDVCSDGFYLMAARCCNFGRWISRDLESCRLWRRQMAARDQLRGAADSKGKAWYSLNLWSEVCKGKGSGAR